jgi:hypothetical protein
MNDEWVGRMKGGLIDVWQDGWISGWIIEWMAE